MTDLIIIDITDTEKAELDGASKLKEISGEGIISIKNPTLKSRLWNLNCDLKEIVNTTIPSRELNIGILESNQLHETNYQIQNIKGPSLKVVEEFETKFINNNCRLTVNIENPLKQAITNIKLSREVPLSFQEIEIQPTKVGVAGIVEDGENQYLNWDILSLEAEQGAKLEILCTLPIEDNQVKSLGALNISYLINNYKLTYISPEIRGFTDSISGIDRDQTSQPGLWDCNLEFINDSEFQVRLEEVKVTHTITTGNEVVVSQTPNRLLNPNQKWNYSFQIESKELPELNPIIGFTPLFVVLTRVKGEIHKEPTIYAA